MKIDRWTIRAVKESLHNIEVSLDEIQYGDLDETEQAQNWSDILNEANAIYSIAHEQQGRK